MRVPRQKKASGADRRTCGLKLIIDGDYCFIKRFSQTWSILQKIHEGFFSPEYTGIMKSDKFENLHLPPLSIFFSYDVIQKLWNEKYVRTTQGLHFS